MERVFVVIAAFNEEHAIADVLKGLRRAGYNDIVVVDDGSKDRTAEIATSNGAHVVRHVINRGQGAALSTGMGYALKNDADIIVHFDADGQQRVEDIAAMIAPIKRDEVDITLGSRFINKGSNVPSMRKFFLQAGAFLFLILYGVKLTDSHNGFRAFSRYAAEKVEIKADRMEHASEIIDQVSKHKLRYVEIPVIVRYTNYSKAHSKQGAFPAIRIFLRTLTHKFLR